VQAIPGAYPEKNYMNNLALFAVVILGLILYLDVWATVSTSTCVIVVGAIVICTYRAVKSLCMACEEPAGIADATVLDADTDSLPALSTDELESRCRVRGRIVGSMIRREMGLPTYTVANRAVALQRIEAHRKKELPHLRVVDGEAFSMHALIWVFTPTRAEMEMHRTLHTLGAASQRVIPSGGYDFNGSFFLRALPTSLSELPLVQWMAVKMGLVRWVGPGFQ
jgi:hypothetical protein